MSETVKNLLDGKKQQLVSWCNNAMNDDDPSRKDGIIASLAKEVVGIERLLELDNASRGLPPETIKMIVDQFYKDRWNLDENNNLIQKETE